MHRIDLQEYVPYTTDFALDKEQLRTLTEDAHVHVAPSPAAAGANILTPSSYIGAVNVGDLAVVIRPKIPSTA